MHLYVTTSICILTILFALHIVYFVLLMNCLFNVFNAICLCVILIAALLFNDCVLFCLVRPLTLSVPLPRFAADPDKTVDV